MCGKLWLTDRCPFEESFSDLISLIGHKGTTHQENDQNRSHSIVGITFAEFISKNIENVVWVGRLLLHLFPLSGFRLFAFSHFQSSSRFSCFSFFYSNYLQFFEKSAKFSRQVSKVMQEFFFVGGGCRGLLDILRLTRKLANTQIFVSTRRYSQ